LLFRLENFTFLRITKNACSFALQLFDNNCNVWINFSLMVAAISDYPFSYLLDNRACWFLEKDNTEVRLQFMFAIILVFILRESVTYRVNSTS